MRYRNFVAFVVLAGLWGTAFMAIKAGLSFFPPVLFAAFRFDLAAVIMLGYAAVVTDRLRPQGTREWLLVVVGGVFIIAGYHALLFIGEQNTTSAVAAVIVSLSPVLTPAFARAFLPSERLSAVGVVGILLGLVGVAVLTRPTPESLLGGDLVPKAFVFAAAVSFALGSVFTERVSASLPAPTMEAWSMVIGAVVLHAASALSAESLADVSIAVPGVAALVYLSVGASAIGFLIYFDLLSRLGPVEINLVSYVAPVFAALTGALFLGEVIDAITVVGFVIIFAGFVLLKRRAIANELPRLRAALSSE
ncbi:DMT(drug/metabolite transporter) superfamily permease [Halococcus morrhuae DSM 1307]|uniref:DMT(Drug/metabolite transporter) superfamily permease n=1 Tax=Halococcus morrhuae DSM 1307 TaxID=931277 RepID=M0M2T2_HALMO|nr:EamA family transporter [Halococcus morrhuae]EMA38919.1 DMT(drug/metabolite transporter) superfamily permease [Halococcus morrhuae DSM 1307]